MRRQTRPLIASVNAAAVAALSAVEKAAELVWRTSEVWRNANTADEPWHSRR